MTALSASSLNSNPCRKTSKIDFFLDDHEALTVTIDTNKLHMRSIRDSKEDFSSYARLFGNKDVMSKYGQGKTKTPEETESLVKKVWVDRWHRNDPYGGFAVFENKAGEFLGHVAIGYGDKEAQAELGYLFMQNHWGKGFGSEAVSTIVREYAPATVVKGYTLAGKTLEEITATARPDNPASVKILKGVGMHLVEEEEKYGALRQHFSIKLGEIIEKV